MSFLDVYIGKLDPAPKWFTKAKAPTGPPKRDSPFFPPSRSSPYSEVKRRIASGEYEGAQVDWGAWVARVSKAQLQSFVAEMYDEDPTYGAESRLPHLIPQLVELRKYVESLEDGQYALVASEL